ncbi:basic helix-loop-helix transcription factor scleraxis-like [Schistocerca serialis cubense]|uniref:basic helix-loop-helix transcription factor scleraxis-like n=1 Tax=Schistocerca serialis cubense TaxID=2023355 RepID=UPI00214F0466|nr:basic helix-loop-helix transcription factor scleraxis-like [Schistocerca serialis cubense]
MDRNNNHSSSTGSVDSESIADSESTPPLESRDSESVAATRTESCEAEERRYGLRPRKLQRSSAACGDSGPAGEKSRRRPAPPSRYRRRAANARERSRTRGLGAAFEALRRALPPPAPPASAAPPTKVVVLRRALRYIAALSAALHAAPSPPPPPPPPPTSLQASGCQQGASPPTCLRSSAHPSDCNQPPLSLPSFLHGF